MIEQAKTPWGARCAPHMARLRCGWAHANPRPWSKWGTGSHTAAPRWSGQSATGKWGLRDV